jgi:DNA-binding NarL/FixJ family response regulator
MSQQINLSIVEDEALVRESLTDFLGSEPEFALHSINGSVESFLLSVEAIDSHILLLDISLPGMSGLEGIDLIREKHPQIDIVMLTSYEDEGYVFEALRGGAVAYLSKSTSLLTIKDALLTVANGGSFMSPSIARHVVNFFRAPQRNKKPEVALTIRQKEILNCLMDGQSYKMIADSCDITLETVRDHIKKIYKKLQINSRGELVSMLLNKNN